MAIYMRRILWFIGLVLAQVLVCNYLHIYGIGTPLVYLYFILKLNSEVGRKELLLWSFAIGLCVDIFSNTPGMNAAAATLLGLCRPTLLRMQMQRDMDGNFEPGIRVMNFSPFLRYLITGVMLHAIVLNLLDAFSFFRFRTLLLDIAGDTLMTVICILCIDTIRRNK